MYGITPEIAARFHNKVAPDENSECRLWTAAVSNHGYGVFTYRLNGQKFTRSAHRVSYDIAVGDIPNGMFVCHRCDNPLCVRPDHLFLGTHTDNMRDASAKGRMKGMSKRECVNGHAFTPENTYWRPTGQRDCRACIRARSAAYARRIAA